MREFDTTVAPFAFGMNEPVANTISEERGVVRGFQRIEEHDEDEFLIEYVDNGGCFQRKWLREGLLTPIMGDDHNAHA